MVNINVQKILIKNIIYSYNLLEKKITNKSYYLNFLFKFNLLNLNIYYEQLWNFFLSSLNRYYYFTKFYYLKTMKVVCLKNFHLTLYLSSEDDIKNKLVKLQTRINKLTFSKRRNRKVKSIKLKKNNKRHNKFKIPFQILSLSLAHLDRVNYGLYILTNKFTVMDISRKLTVNILNQNYIKSGYLKLKYNLYKKFNFPYNVYYRNNMEITLSDVYLFLNKFIGIFTKCGKKSFGYYLIKVFNVWAKEENLNFYKLIRYFIYNYLPFIYLKNISVRRRRITKPTLLSKEKSFFLGIKWWYEAAIVRKERSLAKGLFMELISLNNDSGLVVNKYNSLLLSTYNSRSDLKIFRRNTFKKKLIKTSVGARSINDFIYNNLSKIKNPIYRNNVLTPKKLYNRFKDIIGHRNYFIKIVSSSKNFWNFSNPSYTYIIDNYKNLLDSKIIKGADILDIYNIANNQIFYSKRRVWSGIFRFQVILWLKITCSHFWSEKLSNYNKYQNRKNIK